MIKELNMPPLPEENWGLPHCVNAYTESQMHAYAQAYTAQQVIELETKLAAAKLELTDSQREICDLTDTVRLNYERHGS